MIRLKTYKYGYFKILLLTFSINIVLQPCLGQNLNDGAQDGESDQESQLPGAEEPGSLSPAQPDSIDNAALMKKRMFYGIAVAVPIYLLLSQDEDRDASVSKVGPPPDWPNN